tara:strand:+ start:4090 stop:4563 length:474 start_codon:yes stop_codon:yes gene_type:complete
MKTVFIDMDGVIVNLSENIRIWFSTHPHLKKKYINFPDHIPGIFRDPLPIKGSIKSIQILHESSKYDLFIATSSPWGNPGASTDKRYWIEKYFGTIFHKKLFITHRKDLLIGDFLIDDRLKNGAEKFNGELLRFGVDWQTGEKNQYPDWDSILKKLL